MNTDELQIPWLKSDRPIKIAVVGDVILDEYLEGQVNRISPEAPVPVHRVSRTIHTPGVRLTLRETLS